MYLFMVCLYCLLSCFRLTLFANDLVWLYILRARWYFFLAILHAGPNHGLSELLHWKKCLFCCSEFDAARSNMSAMLLVILS